MRDGFNRLLLEEAIEAEDLGMPEEIQPLDDDMDMGASNDEAPTAPQPQTGVTTIDVDISGFGTDNSDVQNEYDPREVERLNILIASENSAIGEYFTASKETNVDVLRRLYSDIGEEERFHSEQLIFAKSQLTGEKYVPRDPDVKAEYEKLLDMGVDEETAMTTAVDKVGLANRDRTISPEEDDQMRQDLVSDMEVLEYTLYQEALLFQIMTSPAISSLYERDAATASFCEAYLENVESMQSVFIEAVVDTSSLPSSQQKVVPSLISGIINLIKKCISAIKNAGQKFTQFWVGMREKRKSIQSWLKNHSLKDIFAKGYSMYLWNDNTMDFDFDNPAAFINLLYQLTLKIASQFNINVNNVPTKFNLPTGKAIRFSNVEDGLKIAQNAQFVKTKLIVDDNNAQTIASKFFAYSSEKTNSTYTSQEGKSANAYNEMGALATDAGAYLKQVEIVTQELYKLQGQQGGNVQTNPQKFNTAINQMKIISNLYAKWINIINHDMQTMMKINNDVVTAARNEMEAGDAQDSINKYGAEYSGKPKEELEKIKTQLSASKQKDPNNATLTYRIQAIDALLANPNAFDEYKASLQGAGQQGDATAPQETPPANVGTPPTAKQAAGEPEQPAAAAPKAAAGGTAPKNNNAGTSQKKPEQTQKTVPISEQLKGIGIEESLNESDGKRLLDCFNEAKSGNTDSLLKFYIAVLKKHYSTKPNRG